MKKFVIQIIALMLVAFGGLYVYQHPDVVNNFFPNKPQQQPQHQIKLGEKLMMVEVADSESARARGLSGRDAIASDSGMLFAFTESKKHQFWMKGMKFSIDMIFISEGKVVDELKNVPYPMPDKKDKDLPIYQPIVPIDMVLEVAAGFIDQNNVKVGDSLFLIQK